MRRAIRFLSFAGCIIFPLAFALEAAAGHLPHVLMLFGGFVAFAYIATALLTMVEG